MKLSRRNFLGYAACLPTCFTGKPLGNSAWADRAEPHSATSALLLNFSCSLDESFEGYRASLRATGASFDVSSRQMSASAPFIILPTSAMTELSQARWLRTRLEQGATVLVESGGAFLSGSGFRVHQSLLRSQFGLAASEPVSLWSTPDRLDRPPYVDFTWPVAARVRDFSLMVPVNAPTREAIAFQGSQIAALKRRLGAGTIVFLGSPVGPHLLAGDREAQHWFESFLTSTTAGLRIVDTSS
jgi:hypothetical protein